MKYTDNPPEIECPSCGYFSFPLVIETPALTHFAKLACRGCGRFVEWMGMPKNYDKRQQSKFTPEGLGIERCEFCLRSQGMLGDRECLEIHHKMPINLGGEDVESNIWVLCTYCHRTAHQRHTYLYEHFKPKKID